MRTRGSAVVGVLVCALAVGAPALADGADRRGPARPAASADGGRDLRPQHTSDNEPGWYAPPVTARRTAPKRVETATREVVPGVTYTRWTQADARGPIEAHLLAVDLKTRGLRLDYADSGSVRGVATVPDILKIDNAVAGVNGDFYDIGRTGAPLGLGLDLQRGFLHGPTTGWNNAFFLDAKGRPQIGVVPVHLRVRNHPDIELTGMNSPYVARDSVGIYTKGWGRTAGYQVTQGERKGVRAVWMVGSKVVRVTNKLNDNKLLKGSLIVGRGEGAKQLRVLKPGMTVRIARSVDGAPRMAITGNKLLVDDGIVRVIDNAELHPRTAVGIDRDTGQVLLLVVDGRSRASRGYSLLEMANLMIDLGADEALNLDGGGSSTMVAAGLSGRRRVVNTPSDGFLRRVSNALEITYRPPGRKK